MLNRIIGIATSAALLMPVGAALAEERPYGPPIPRPEVGKQLQGSSNPGPRKVSSTTPPRMMTSAEKQARMASTTKRLGDIKDKVKQEQAGRIAEQFEKINKKWTDQFSSQLDHYETILGKVEARAVADANDGKDTGATTGAVAAAEAKIANARAAVAAQATKTYVLDPAVIPTVATTTPAGQDKLVKTLRTAFQETHKSLFQDLFALRDGAMKDARKAVQEAIRTLGGGKGPGNTATSTTETN